MNRYVVMIAVLGCVTLATIHKLGNDFVYDDRHIIEHGNFIHDLRNARELFLHDSMYAVRGYEDTPSVAVYRPIWMLTFMLDAAIWGKNPVGYHITNLLAHLICVWLVFRLAEDLLEERRKAFALLAAAWFGLSPFLGEAHVCINGRSDVFCLLFGLTAIILWRRTAQSDLAGAGRYAYPAAGLIFLLGLLSKEILIMTLPALVFWPYPAGVEPSLAARLRRGLPFILASVVYLLLRVSALGGLQAYGGAEQLTSAAIRLPVLLLDGAAQTVFPYKLYLRSMRDDYGALGTVWPVLSAVAVMLLAVGLFRARKRLPLPAWSSLWFASGLCPTAIIATMLWPGFGRYLYLPFAELAVGLIDLVARGFETAFISERPGMRRLIFAGFIGYLALLGFRLHSWVYDFADEKALYGAIVREAPGDAHGYGWLGMYEARSGYPEQALRAFAAAARLNPREMRYQLGLATAWLTLGKCDQALQVARRGIKEYASPYEFHMLAAACLLAEQPAAAQKHLEICLKLNPQHPICRLLLRKFAGAR